MTGTQATPGRKAAAGAALCLAMLASSPAGAACESAVQINPSVRPLPYDPFEAGDTVMQGSILVRQDGPEPCPLRLGFYRSPDVDVSMRQTSGASFGTGPLRYELTSNGRRLIADWPQNSKPPIFVVVPAVGNSGQTAEVNYQLRIPRGQLAAPGIYTDEVELRAYEINGKDLLALRVLNLEAEVSSVVSLNLVGADVSSPYSYTMDFGTLETGERRSIGIEARSNGRYRLEVRSREGGVLRLAPPFDNWTIDYAASIAGQSVNFPASLGSFSPTAASGAVLPLQVVIGDVASKRAGIYRDEITVSIEPAP